MFDDCLKFLSAFSTSLQNEKKIPTQVMIIDQPITPQIALFSDFRAQWQNLATTYQIDVRLHTIIYTEGHPAHAHK